MATSAARRQRAPRATRASTVPGFTQQQLVLVLGALIVSVFLASLDTSIVTTALPTIAGQFKAFESLPWVGTAYIVTSTIATPLLGKLSDLYGRRLVYQATMAMFFLGSLLCGLAQSMGQLIAFRAVQGLGGGGIQALAWAVMGDILPPRERGRYIGYFTIAFAVSAVGGPLVGGAIVDHADWHWIFLINLPLVAGATVITHVALRLPFVRRNASIDWAGIALLSGGLALAMIGLERGVSGWTRPTVLGLLLAGAVLLAAFVLQERRASEPMLPLRLFRNRAVVISAALGFVASCMSFGANTYLPLYFQDALFVRPTLSGLRMVPVMIGVVVTSFGCGRLIARNGRYRIYPIAGTAAMAVGMALLTRIDGSTTYGSLVVPMLLLGLGSGAIYTTTSIAAQNACDLRDLGVTTAAIMFFRSLGGSVGLAGFGTLLNGTIRSELPKRTGLDATASLKLIRAPKQIAALPAATRQAVVDAIALGASHIYLVAAVGMVVAVVIAYLMPELPLRATAGISDRLADH